MGLSTLYGQDVAMASAALTLTTIAYDECALASHWIGKNACNIAGYVTFEIGASKLMGEQRKFSNTILLISYAGENNELDTIAINAILYSAIIIFTTIQSQDFPDVEGDASIGRVTFPIYAPEVSRIVTLVALIGWSLLLCALWTIGPLSASGFCTLGAYVGWRFYYLRTEEQDKASYRIFNVRDSVTACQTLFNDDHIYV